MPMIDQAKIWAIVPAAGIGSRMQSEVPKQYLSLRKQTLLEVTLKKILQLNEIQGIILPLHPDDTYWPKTTLYKHPKIHCIEGGEERADSVALGLAYCLENMAVSSTEETLWALVHDAARPCVSVEKIAELISVGIRNKEANISDGAILAVPCADTVKRVNETLIQHTEDRSQLWLAHTPQFFPLKMLSNAIKEAGKTGCLITDEASAIEAVGGSVSVVQDRRDNIKVTVPEDLLWAETLLHQQGFES